ncbi:MAG: protease inhibitor I9 family protein, partial [Actinomycetota bacterium]|nr:protease inhibitor I9 family protein [Actinomycetota bacterium]
MPVKHPARSLFRRTISGLGVAALASAGLVTIAPAATAASSADRSLSAGRYIVTFADEPAASYEGGIAGYARTRPDAGKKLDPTRPEVVRYRQRLAGLHDSALSKAGAIKLYDYSVATNGVLAELTATQARKLAGTAGVAGLEKDSLRHPDTTYSPQFLG